MMCSNVVKIFCLAQSLAISRYFLTLFRMAMQKFIARRLRTHLTSWQPVENREDSARGVAVVEQETARHNSRLLAAWITGGGGGIFWAILTRSNAEFIKMPLK